MLPPNSVKLPPRSGSICTGFRENACTRYNDKNTPWGSAQTDKTDQRHEHRFQPPQELQHQRCGQDFPDTKAFFFFPRPAEFTRAEHSPLVRSALGRDQTPRTGTSLGPSLFCTESWHQRCRCCFSVQPIPVGSSDSSSHFRLIAANKSRKK